MQCQGVATCMQTVLEMCRLTHAHLHIHAPSNNCTRQRLTHHHPYCYHTSSHCCPPCTGCSCKRTTDNGATLASTYHAHILHILLPLPMHRLEIRNNCVRPKPSSQDPINPTSPLLLPMYNTYIYHAHQHIACEARACCCRAAQHPQQQVHPVRPGDGCCETQLCAGRGGCVRVFVCACVCMCARVRARVCVHVCVLSLGTDGYVCGGRAAEQGGTCAHVYVWYRQCRRAVPLRLCCARAPPTHHSGCGRAQQRHLAPPQRVAHTPPAPIADHETQEEGGVEEGHLRLVGCTAAWARECVCWWPRLVARSHACARV